MINHKEIKQSEISEMHLVKGPRLSTHLWVVVRETLLSR